MRHLLALTVITLFALGTGCAWISPSSQTTNDGIHVHGHWTMTVTNPDGSVDAVHEFDNGLKSNGVLSSLVAGKNQIDKHLIKLGTRPQFDCIEQHGSHSPGDNLIKSVYLGATVTQLEEPGLPLRISAACTATNMQNDDNKGKIVSVGTALVDLDKCINTWTVFADSSKMACSSMNQTGFYKLAPEWNPIAGESDEEVFTQKGTVDVELSDGQMIAITVSITFE
tara:strand:+ start:808 stop:1482 length:675 start_codon:yes stop_codon:yes gene_type:complete